MAKYEAQVLIRFECEDGQYQSYLDLHLHAEDHEVLSVEKIG
jgi:hypothetical protein